MSHPGHQEKSVLKSSCLRWHQRVSFLWFNLFPLFSFLLSSFLTSFSSRLPPASHFVTLLYLLTYLLFLFFPLLYLVLFILRFLHLNLGASFPFILLTANCLGQVKLKVTLRLTVSQSASLGVEPHLGLMTRYLTIWQLRSCFCGASSLTRGRVCLLYTLLGLPNAVFLGSESLGTRDHILLSQIWDFLFRRLLRLAGLRWRYSTPPPHGHVWVATVVFKITSRHGPHGKRLLYCLEFVYRAVA
jgi:hypothetical protein